MNNFVIEKYLMYVKSIQSGKTIFYIVEKREVTGVSIKRISNNKKEDIDLNDIKDEFVKENVKEISTRINLAQIRYAVKQLVLLLRNEELDIMKYCNAKQYKIVSNDRYSIRIVRYYYNPKGKLFEKLFNKKW